MNIKEITSNIEFENIITINKNNKEMLRFVGVRSEDVLTEAIDRALA